MGRTIYRNGAVWVTEAGEVFASADDGDYFVKVDTGEYFEIVERLAEDKAVIA